MSNDTTNSHEPAGDAIARQPAEHDRIMARYRSYQAAAAETLTANKATLFPLLTAAGITTILVRFDGYGDSGQIEEVDAFRGEEPAELPDDMVEFLQTNYGADRVFCESLSIAQSVERLSYALLSSEHGGWENNDGAYGTFCLDIAAGTIALDFNYRVTSSEHHEHIF